MPVTIYYTYFESPLSENKYQFLLKELPIGIAKQIHSFSKWEDRHTNLFGKLLLKKAFSESRLKYSLHDVRFSQFGRPYVGKGLDFNISHSDKAVTCIVSDDSRVGIDLEIIKPINIVDYETMFTPEEWKDLYDNVYDNKLFFNYWTRKEAVMKADGRGISKAFTQLNVANLDEVTLSGLNWKIVPVEFLDNYCCHFASSNEITFYLKKVVYSD